MLTLDIPKKTFLYGFINLNILGVNYRAPLTEHQLCTTTSLREATHLPSDEIFIHYHQNVPNAFLATCFYWPRLPDCSKIEVKLKIYPINLMTFLFYFGVSLSFHLDVITAMADWGQMKLNQLGELAQQGMVHRRVFIYSFHRLCVHNCR